ncbi:hypothetical protein ABZZ20_03375 [Streptomyces sp. NPDC006430]|uniref:hypothetical protein n=1 Tax=Streptomyces sp. NPDC006430 TaxID=3154299 RepID=UPI0033BF16B6
MAPGSGPARWNPQSQQWEVPAAGEEVSEPDPKRLPPKPAHPPGAPRPDARTAVSDVAEGSTEGAGATVDGPQDASGDGPADAPEEGFDGPPPVRRGAFRRWRPAVIVLGLVGALGGAALTAPLLLEDPSALPSGYKVLRSAGSGFQIAVPDSWDLSSSETGAAAGTVYRPAQGRDSLLQVFPVTTGPTNPCEVLIEGTKDMSGRDGYRRLSLDAKAGPGCELVFDLPDQDVQGTGRGIARLTVASDGSRWMIMAFGPAAEAKTVRARLTAALGSFRPD